MLAVIETHPVQYHAPVYRALQQRFGVPVTAIYGSDFSVAGYRDPEFGVSFAWDNDLLSGYSTEFLSRVASGGASRYEQVTARGLSGVLQALRPEAALILGYSPRFHRVAWFEALRAGCRVLFRGETNDEARSRGWLKSQARRTALKLAYQSCDRLLYIGERSRQHFLGLGISPDRLVFSPYCVDTSPFQCGEPARAEVRDATRERLSIGPRDRLLLFAGKLSERKGVDLIVRAVRRLPQPARDGIVIGFLGDGQLRDRLASDANEDPVVRARFLGFQNQHALSAFYHAADVLLLPSRSSETWGLVVNEALHHGIPCLVSDRVGCAADLVRPGTTGEICTADSVEALSAAIDRALSLCDRRDVRDACRDAVSRYTVDEAAAGIAAAYGDTIAHRDSAA